MENKKSRCPICRMPLDGNHFAPVLFPGIDQEVCCNCDENLGLMFTNFDQKPGTKDDGYIVPDYSDRLHQITGRSYLENRLIFYRYCLKRELEKEKIGNEPEISRMQAEIEKIKLELEKIGQRVDFERFKDEKI